MLIVNTNQSTGIQHFYPSPLFLAVSLAPFYCILA